MKKFSLGLVIGLLVGLLGVLAYIKFIGVETSADDVDSSRKRFSRNSANAEAELELARIKLRTYLRDQPDKYKGTIDFIDSAIFDQEWAAVFAASEHLRSLKPVGKNKNVERVAAPSAELSFGLKSQQLKLERFWLDLYMRENPAVDLRGEEAEKVYQELHKILRRVPGTDAEKQTFHDALYLMARDCGAKGFAEVKEILKASTTPPKVRKMALQALARSNHPDVLDLVLSETLDDAVHPSYTVLAIQCLELIPSVLVGDEKTNEQLVTLAKPGRPEEIRVQALLTAAEIEWRGFEPTLKEIARVIKDEADDMQAAGLQAISTHGRTYLTVPAKLLELVDQFARRERQHKARGVAFDILGRFGTKEHLQTLRDLEGTTSNPKQQAELQQAQTRLIKRIGEH